MLPPSPPPQRHAARLSCPCLQLVLALLLYSPQWGVMRMCAATLSYEAPRMSAGTSRMSAASPRKSALARTPTTRPSAAPAKPKLAVLGPPTAPRL
eukprot:577309-Prymnesium_polylepis.1